MRVIKRLLRSKRLLLCLQKETIIDIGSVNNPKACSGRNLANDFILNVGKY